jgi:hypothetical protein
MPRFVNLAASLPHWYKHVYIITDRLILLHTKDRSREIFGFMFYMSLNIPLPSRSR